MASVRPGILTLLLPVLLAYSISADSFGNFLDVSWRLPEPKGAPRSACEKDIRDMYAGLRNMTLWAHEMWDATARAPSGALHGDVFHLGNFDECIGEAQPDDGSSGPARQFCLVNVTMRPVQNQVHPHELEPHGSAYNKIYGSGNLSITTRNMAMWAVCAPASCRPSEVIAMLQAHFHDESVRIAGSRQRAAATPRHEFQAHLMPKACQTADDAEPITYGAIAFFLVVGTLLAAVVLATAYDHIVRGLNIKKDECPTSVTAFSLFNSMKMLRQKDRASELQVLNGLRVISIVMVIFGHRLGGTVSGPVTNRDFLEMIYTQFSSAFIAHGDLVVDTFLLMSGVLLVHGVTREQSKERFSIALMVVYRYIRLVPAYALVILFMGHVLPLTGSGPLWHFIVDVESEPCRANWWTNLLIINNYVNTEQLCMLQSWYIPCDFHFFIISLGIVWSLRSRSLAPPGLVYLALLLALSILIPGFITYFLELPAILVFDSRFFDNPRLHRVFQEIYVKSHNRASSYLIGVLTGYLLVKHHRPGKKAISTKMSTLGAAAAVLVILTIITFRIAFYTPTRPYNVVEAALYASLHRPVWCLAMGLLILCCTLGNVPPVSGFLGCSKFEPIAKLSFGAYLTHMAIQFRDLGLARAPKYVHKFTIIGQLIGDLTFSFMASFLIYITIEAPVRQLLITLVTSKSSNAGASSTKPDNTRMLMDTDDGEVQTGAVEEPKKKKNNPPGLRHRDTSSHDEEQNIKDI